MKILSLFDGISCARVALDRAKIPVETYWAVEIDKYATQISQKNYPDILHSQDVRTFVGVKNSFDLLIGGSPCQDLSIAKKDRKGLEGERSSLFWEYVRILNEVKPTYFILENVASMPKKDKDIISETLGVEPVMINAALVSAQNRKRLFWVGKWNGEKYQQVDIPLPEDRGILLKDILEQEVNEKYFIKTERKNTFITNRPQDIENPKASTLLVGGTLPTIRIGEIGKGGQGDRIYSPEGKSVNLSANGGGRGAKTGLYAVAQRGRNIVNGKRKDVLGAKTQQRIEIKQSNKAHTITSVQKDSMVMNNLQVRKLTPVECERLQSLPDNYTEGISNTQRYKALGNGFNVEVIAHILKYIKL